MVREQYYIDLLKPEYNILLVAGSSFPCGNPLRFQKNPAGVGYKHYEAALAKLIGRKLSLEHLTKLKEHLTKHNASAEQRIKAKARMLKINEKKRNRCRSIGYGN